MPLREITYRNIDCSITIMLADGDMTPEAIRGLLMFHFDDWTGIYLPYIATQKTDASTDMPAVELNDIIEVGSVSFAVSYLLTIREAAIDQDWLSAYLRDCTEYLKRCFYERFGSPRFNAPPFDPSTHDDDLSQLGFGGLLTEPLTARLAG